MHAFEYVSGFVVVEGFCVPLNKGKIFAVVFGVAAGALPIGSGGNVITGMKPVVGVETVCDFGVAVQAFEGGLTSELVTTGAVGRSVQRRMRAGQRPGRNLRGARGGKQEYAHYEQNDSESKAGATRGLS